MPTEFTLPELGENITAGDVVRVLVAPGDTVASDQPVLELETDKATIEVPSTVSGTVAEVRVKQGDRVNVGEVVLVVEDGAGEKREKREEREKKDEEGAGEKKPERAEPAPQEEPAEKAEGSQPAERPAPQPSGAPEEGGISQAAPGRAGEVARGRDGGDGGSKGAAERNRGRISSEPDERLDDMPPAPEPAAPSGARQRPRGEVVEMTRAARPSAAAAAPQTAEEPAKPLPPAAPSVRRLARELGVDIHRVAGSGPAGRISADDVQAFVRAAMSGGGSGAAAAPLPDFSRWGGVERKPMSTIRRKTAEHLSRAWTTIPHVTQHDRADITALEALRKQYGPQAEKAGGKLTMTAIALKVAERALRRFPQFNASVDSAANEIVYKEAVHIGVAVDTERGLLVPVIRDVDRKGIIELSVELSRLSEKARAGKLSLGEMQGGGFTITNLGGIGGTAFTPIVNWPEVAILGISRGALEPFWTGSAFEPRLLLPLSLSYDHRVIDGADAARFLRWVAEAFEQPFVMQL